MSDKFEAWFQKEFPQDHETLCNTLYKGTQWGVEVVTKKLWLQQAFKAGHNAATTVQPAPETWAYSFDGEKFYGSFQTEQLAYESAVDETSQMKKPPMEIYTATIIDTAETLLHDCSYIVAENVIEILEDSCCEFIDKGDEEFIVKVIQQGIKTRTEAYDLLGRKLVAIALNQSEFTRFGVKNIKRWSAD